MLCGEYNFLFNNCSDYTNALLDVADIDGMASQILSEGNGLISIPVLREFGLSVSAGIDSLTNWVSDGLVNVGDSIKGNNIVGDIVGDILVGTGNYIDASTNFVGDVVDVGRGLHGKVVDGLKYISAGITNVIADGAQKAWDWISFWD